MLIHEINFSTENEDPMTIKKRIEEQLMEEANRMGANLSPGM